MKRIILLIVAVTLTAATAQANPNAGTETGESKKTGRDISDSVKQTDEKGTTTSNRKSSSESTGSDKQWQDAVRSVQQESSNTSADITMPLETLFLSQILKLEKEREPFSSCLLMSKPKLPKDYGITAAIGKNNIDVANQTALTDLAISNAPVSDFRGANEHRIQITKKCMAYYGGIIAQAYLETESSIAALSIKPPDTLPKPAPKDTGKTVKKGAKKSKKNKKSKQVKKEHEPAETPAGLTIGVEIDKTGGKRITGIGRDDYIALATEALNNALKNGITDKRIRERYLQIMEDDRSCYFAGAIDKILCGSSMIILGAQQKLYGAGDVEVYGHSFMGLQGAYKISRAFNLSQSYDKMASTSRYSKQMAEISKSIDKMQREGRALEASMAKRIAIEQSMSGRKSLDLSGIIPGLKGQ